MNELRAMNQKPVNIGVIGMGRFGRLHSQTIQGLSDCRLTAIVARRQQSLDEAASQLTDVPGFLSIEEACQQTDTEAWVIAASTSEHVTLATLLLREGYSVLLEKPISESLSEADSLGNLVRDDSANLMIGHIVLFNSEFLQLQEEAARRSPLIHISAVRHRPSSIIVDFPGENPLHAAMVHDLYCVQALTGGTDPDQMSAQYLMTEDRSAVRLACAQLQWNTGVLATLSAGYLTPDGMPPRGYDCLEVFGSDWAARTLPNPRPIQVWSEAAEWPMPLEIRAGASPAGMLAEELRCFSRVVRGTQRVPRGATYHDALQVQRWLEELHQSATTSRTRP